MRAARRALVVVAIVHAVGPGASVLAQVQQKPLDLVLALDNSGSMRMNDPAGLMRSAAADFAKQLGPDSNVALVIFDKTMAMPLQLTSVGADDFSGRLGQALSRLDYKGPLTDIPGAIERSLYEIREHGRAKSRRVILLFTDGFVDLGDAAKNRARTDWLLTDLLSDVRREQVHVFGIAFTDGADFSLIQSVSQNTDGQYFRLRRADQISDIFRQVTARLNEPPATAAPPTATLTQPSNVIDAHTVMPVAWIVGVSLSVAVVLASGFWYVRAQTVGVPGTLQDLLDPSRVHSIDRRVFRIGSEKYKGLRRNHLVIPLATVSRGHATIKYRDGLFYLHDDGSRNHTFLKKSIKEVEKNEQLRPREPYELKPGDLIRFDTREFRFGFAAGVMTPRRPGRQTEFSSDENQVRAQMPDAKGWRDPGPPPARTLTQPPPGYADTPRGSDSTPSTPDVNQPVTIQCQNCDHNVHSSEVTLWQGIALCKRCEVEMLNLPSSAAAARHKALLEKRQRRLKTIEA